MKLQFVKTFSLLKQYLNDELVLKNVVFNCTAQNFKGSEKAFSLSFPVAAPLLEPAFGSSFVTTAT